MRTASINARAFMNTRAFVVPAIAALVLSACVIGASSPADARFMMPMMHMPVAHGPMMHGPVNHGPAAGARLNSRVRSDGSGRTVRIPPHYHPKLNRHPIDTVTNDCGDGRRYRRGRCGGTRHHGGVGIVGLPVSTAGGAAIMQQGGWGGGGANNSVPRGERRFVPDEVITEFSTNASPRAIAQVARRLDLTRLETQRFDLIGGTLYRWRIGGRRTVPAVVNALANQRIVALVQPNYLFVLEDEMASGAAALHGDPGQYVLRKLEIEQAHQLATGKSVLLAVVDSAIDGSHPDLAGSIAKNFDALGGKTDPQLHGTEMAGAIAAHGKLLGIAPGVQILAARAFDNRLGKARGTSFDIFKSLQWAADNGARVINMSFAGPADPTLHRILAAAYAKDIVLIAAAGNDGPDAAPAYPGADPHVIAVTATDADDQPFKLANHGQYIAVAAPGVEILALAPDASYQITTGTSVSAAHVSGIAALLLQRDPALTPAQIRAVLMATAKPLGAASQHDEFGAGLVDAYRAVMAPQIKAAGGGGTREQATR
jgi:subtilisin family serine protease